MFSCIVDRIVRVSNDDKVGELDANVICAKFAHTADMVHVDAIFIHIKCNHILCNKSQPII